jgi:OPA family sugar phosphate sensor protein UhpC-like MFS transporter
MMERYGEVRTAADGGLITIPYWPAAFWGPAAVLTLVLVVSYVLLRNRPEDVGLPPIETYHGEPVSILDDEDRKHISEEGSWQLIGEVLRSPTIWMLAIAYFSIKLVRYAFYIWGPKYVNEQLGEGAIESTLIAAAMPIGGLVGVIATGYVSDKLFRSRRAPVIVISLLIATAIMLLGLSSIDNKWLMAGFFFLVGVFLFGPDSMISATAAMDFGTKRGAGTAVGCINGIGSIGGVLGGWLPGRITTEGDWTPLFVVFLVGLAVSTLVLVPLWRTTPPEA